MNDQLRVVDALNDNVEVVDWNAVVEHTRVRSVPTACTSPSRVPGRSRRPWRWRWAWRRTGPSGRARPRPARSMVG